MNWEEVKKWEYVVDSVALEYHKKFDMVEIPDLRQALWLWFAEHPNKLKEWEAIGERDAKNLIYRSLRNQAIDYCQRWKANRRCRHPIAQKHKTQHHQQWPRQ